VRDEGEARGGETEDEPDDVEGVEDWDDKDGEQE